MRRAYESTKSLEEKLRGSKPNTGEVAVHSIRFYSKVYMNKIYGFYSERKIGREKGRTKEKRSLTLKGQENPVPWAEGRERRY